MLELRPYLSTDGARWDALIEVSRNGNMQHRRAYMDYHAHRFNDASLLLYRRGEAVAAFPANVIGDCVFSHGGLSYAGLISTQSLRAEGTLEAFEQMAEHFRRRGVRTMVYKPVPHVFHRYPAEDDLYALQRVGARLVRRDASSVIPLQGGYSISSARRRAVKSSQRAGVVVREHGDLVSFHHMLTDALKRHHVVPAHSVAELELLQSRFPEQIVLHQAERDGTPLAGVLTYDYGAVVHTQYIAATEDGRTLNALSLLLSELIESRYADRSYLSFGISTEQQGKVLNAGLVAQKESFGARTVVHDTYEWDL